MRRIALLLPILMLASGCASWPEPYWPDEGWREIEPERAGMDSGRLAGALELIQQEDLRIHDLLIIRHGYVVLDAAFWPYRPGTDHDVASVTKSVVASLVAYAADRGRLRFDDPVLSRFAGRSIAHMDDHKRAMRIEDLLTMRTGLRNDEMPDLFKMIDSPDWVQDTLDRPMDAPPGTRFNYNSAASHLLSRIRHDAEEGQPPAESELFRALGIRIASWPTDPQGVVYGGGDLHMTPRDLAKLGMLYLRQGRWRDQQLLPADWIREATRPQTKTPDQELDYGFHWWVFEGGFAAMGRGGQYLAVVPAADLIVVAVSGASRGSGPAFDRVLREHIMGALLPRPSEPGAAAAELRSRIESLQRPPKPHAHAPLPPTAQRIAGARWVLAAASPNDPDSFRFDFPDPAAGRLTLERNGTTTELLFGLDGVPRITPRPSGVRSDPRALDLPAALRGHWRDERTLVLDWDEINNINRWTATIEFDGDQARIRFDEATYLPSEERLARRE